MQIGQVFIELDSKKLTLCDDYCTLLIAKEADKTIELRLGSNLDFSHFKEQWVVFDYE